MATMPRHANASLGAAFAAGALAVGTPCAAGYAMLAGEDLLEVLALTLMVVALGGVLVAVLLLRLRRFSWRNHAHPVRIAAAFGAAGTAAGFVLAMAVEDGPSVVVPLMVAAFAAPFVHRRIP